MTSHEYFRLGTNFILGQEFVCYSDGWVSEVGMEQWNRLQEPEMIGLQKRPCGVLGRETCVTQSQVMKK